MATKFSSNKADGKIGGNLAQGVSAGAKISEEDFQSIGAIGAMYYEQGNIDKAQTIFEGLVELNPNSSAAQSALGGVLTYRREDEKALIHLTKAIDLDDKQIAPFVNRAEIYLRQSKLDLAVADLKRAIELDPKEKDAGANRARAMVLGIYQAIESQEARQKTNKK